MISFSPEKYNTTYQYEFKHHEKPERDFVRYTVNQMLDAVRKYGIKKDKVTGRRIIQVDLYDDAIGPELLDIFFEMLSDASYRGSKWPNEITLISTHHGFKVDMKAHEEIVKEKINKLLQNPNVIGKVTDIKVEHIFK